MMPLRLCLHGRVLRTDDRQGSKRTPSCLTLMAERLDITGPD